MFFEFLNIVGNIKQNDLEKDVWLFVVLEEATSD